MKLKKYNLSYNTRDLVNTLVRSASDRKCLNTVSLKDINLLTS